MARVCIGEHAPEEAGCGGITLAPVRGANRDNCVSGLSHAAFRDQRGPARRMAHFCNARLAWDYASTHEPCSGAAMTWDQVVTWFILPAVVALILGGGWLSRRTP